MFIYQSIKSGKWYIFVYRYIFGDPRDEVSHAMTSAVRVRLTARVVNIIISDTRDGEHGGVEERSKRIKHVHTPEGGTRTTTEEYAPGRNARVVTGWC